MNFIAIIIIIVNDISFLLPRGHFFLIFIFLIQAENQILLE